MGRASSGPPSDSGSESGEIALDPRNESITWRETALFSLFGLGPSWLVVACMYQQVPAFERSLPEEYCIAAYLAVVISFSVLFIVANLIYMRYFGTCVCVCARVCVRACV